MKLIFAGTPEFAQVALAALLAAGHPVALVLTQPDRPAGRGLKLQPSPVKALALAHGIPVAQPRSLRLDGKYPEDAAAAQAQISAAVAAGAQAMVVAAYGLILPAWVLAAPPLGCINIHASLLPRWRGAAPIHRAVEAGDVQTGITIMQMDAGLDTGDMLLVRNEAIRTSDTTGSLHDRLAMLGGEAVVEALALLQLDKLVATPQPKAGEPGFDAITYAHKIDKAEAALDWQQSAETLARKVQALNPAPGCSTVFGHTDAPETLKIWAARALDGAEADRLFGSFAATTDSPDSLPAGTVLACSPQGVDILCGGAKDGEASGAKNAASTSDAFIDAASKGVAPISVLRLTELQKAGGKKMPAAELLRGQGSGGLQVGARLGVQ